NKFRTYLNFYGILRNTRKRRIFIIGYTTCNQAIFGSIFQPSNYIGCGARGSYANQYIFLINIEFLKVGPGLGSVIFSIFHSLSQCYISTRDKAYNHIITNPKGWRTRSEEHTSELQSRENLVC